MPQIKQNIARPRMRILVGISGSVAACALPQYVMALQDHFASDVDIILTESARKFVTSYALSLHISGQVYEDMFDRRRRVPHIELASRSDVFLVLPSTANTLSRAAAGLAGDLLSLSILSSRQPVIFGCCMNDAMWSNPILQGNVKRLRMAGHIVLEPTLGIEISDGANVVGAMPSLSTILATIQELTCDTTNLARTPVDSPATGPIRETQS